jgi:hypothetical protein
MSETPNFQRSTLYHLSRSDYEKVGAYQKPDLAFAFSRYCFASSQVGPLKALDFKIPTSQTETMYFQSINLTVDRHPEASPGHRPDEDDQASRL